MAGQQLEETIEKLKKAEKSASVVNRNRNSSEKKVEGKDKIEEEYKRRKREAAKKLEAGLLELKKKQKNI
ncbi:MAG: hypothetical protein ACFFB5_23540 [Promethearchaeota archaeon]